MKCRRLVADTPVIFAIDAFETCFSSNSRISPSLPSSLDEPREPLGRPSKRPQVRGWHFLAAGCIDDADGAALVGDLLDDPPGLLSVPIEVSGLIQANQDPVSQGANVDGKGHGAVRRSAGLVEDGLNPGRSPQSPGRGALTEPYSIIDV
jgi:hypothetical protein